MEVSDVMKMSEERDVVGLINALKDPNHFVRRNAIDALGQVIDVRAVEPLAEALFDDDLYCRKWAARSLGRIGDKRAVEQLEKTFKDERCIGSREKAAAALIKIDPEWTPRDDEEFGYYWIAKRDPRMIRNLGKKALGPIIEALNDTESGDLRAMAAELLGEIEDPRVIGPLTEAAKDETALVRFEANNALASLRKKGIA